VASSPAPPPAPPPPPPPPPPKLTAGVAHVSGVLARRGVTVRVSCDVRCTLVAVGTLAPRVVARGHQTIVRLHPARRTLPAGGTRLVRLVLARQRLGQLRKALRKHRGLVAQVQLTATVPGAPPTVVTQRLLVKR
jgi:hypothetical protein